MGEFEDEVRNGRRFAFGGNWKSFISNLHEERIKEAEASLLAVLKLNALEGKSFIDVGSGSGLFSLAACRLGARVSSFDYDPESVHCTAQLRLRYFPENDNWRIEQGSVLNDAFVKSLGEFDVVYSWGVLHHTGDMWKALGNVACLVKKNGILCVAIYNNQGGVTKFWWQIKRLYCSGFMGKLLVCGVFIPYFFVRAVVSSVVRQHNVFLEYKKNRGMSLVHDWFDWMGGFPYETAKVDDVFAYYQARGFRLKNIITSPGAGCNQFVFVRNGGLETN